jgi:hypothetical protein
MLHNVIINYTRRIFKIKNKKRLLPTKPIKSDIWLASFPKSGNTWMRFILSNIMTGYCKKNIEINFNNIQDIIPDIYINNDIPIDLGFSPFPRIIKTHEKYNKKLKNSIYIVRNPKDVMVSFYHYMKDGCDQDIKNFSDFLRNKKYGIDPWCKNIKSWANKANVIISFENLKKNPKKEIKKIINFLNIEIEDSLINEAINKSTFEKMKKIEKQDESWKEKHNLNKNYSFIRKGEVNQGKTYFNTEDLKYFNKIILKYNLKNFLTKIKND